MLALQSVNIRQTIDKIDVPFGLQANEENLRLYQRKEAATKYGGMGSTHY